MIAAAPHTVVRARRIVGGAFLAVVALLSLAAGAAARQAPAFMPPGGPMPSCKANMPDLGTDWTTWKGGETSRSRKDLAAIASEYAAGSARVKQDLPTARRLIEYLKAKDGNPIDLAVAEARLELAEQTPGSRDRSRELLDTAAAAGSRTAALMIGDMLVGSDPEAALSYYGSATAGGDARAAIALARLLSSRPGVDPTEIDLAVLNAFTIAIARVSEGDCWSARAMSQLYSDGSLVDPRPDLSAAWKEYAAELGDTGAAYQLAYVYRKGLGVTQDPARAEHFLQIAGRSDRPSMILPIGIVYLVGDGIKRDPVKAEATLRRAAELGKAEAWHYLAQLWRGDYGDKPQPALAFDALKRALSVPSSTSAVSLELGRAYRDGLGTAPDPKAALDLLIRSADGGSPEGALEAAELLEAGPTGVERNLKHAIRLYRLAASGGEEAAATRLASIFRCGNGVDRSLDLASTWSERAAFLGSASSMRTVAGGMLRSDDPVIHSDGFLLLRQSAKSGNLDAIADMVIAYESGQGPETADAATAARWIEHGHRQPAEPGAFDIALGRARLATGSDGFAEAEVLLEKAQAAGNPSAGYELARALDGAGLAEPDRLIELLLPPATAGVLPAMRKLGEVIGLDASAGGKTGREWLTLAAAQDDFAAHLALSADLDPDGRKAALDVIETEGLACTPSDFVRLAVAWNRLGEAGRDKAASYADLAARTVAGDDGSTLFQIADVLLVAGGSVDQARGLLDRAVAIGEPKALVRLAQGLAAGTFGPADPEKARALLLSRGDAGDHDADIALLRLAGSGLLSPDGKDIARVMDRIGADIGSLSGDVLKIASRARDGVFGPEGKERARDWLQKAAEGGRVAAMRALAEILLYGSDAERNPTEGLAWMKRAADTGDREALLALSAAYEVGFLVPVDRDQAAALRAAADIAATGATTAPATN